MSEPLYNEVAEVLTLAGRKDLAARLYEVYQALGSDEVLTSTQAAALLGVSSVNTVKNWLTGGHFPGATRTPGGHWRFVRSEVLAVRERMSELRARNARGDLSPPDVDGREDEPPLL